MDQTKNLHTLSSDRIVKIAMIGDQGLGEKSRKLLRVIKRQNADLLLINGDFDYKNDPYGWERMNRDILGEDFPIIAVLGNHDLPQYDAYKDIITRWNNNPQLDCKGDPGVRSDCTFKGIQIVSSSPGIFPDQSSEIDQNYIHNAFAQSTSPWRICQWHKTMHDMQTGTKEDETGWGVYEECRENGAIITTGHEHAYARSYLLSDIPNKQVASFSDIYDIEKGKSLVLLSGLGGLSSRHLRHDGYWWAHKENLDTGTDAGALICAFNLDNRQSSCYFIDENGETKDSFTLRTHL